MMTQLALDLRSEKRRLSNQCGKILERLLRGPVSNRELADYYCLNYTARLSDLRKKGHIIEPLWRDRASGETHYGLLIDGEVVRR